MKILNILNEHYSITFDNLELMRDMGSTSYCLFSGADKYFLRVVKPAFYDTAVIGVDIQVFLQNRGFPVPSIIFTKNNLPYIGGNDISEGLLILYEFIEGSESNPEQDAEAIGALVGRLHRTMKEYPGKLVKRDKHFYIGRYIDFLRNRKYPRAEEFFIYGEQLWNKIKALPHGFCHGDMYSGNIYKTSDGRLFLLDFDTSCDGIPMYDLALICNMTEYFHFDEQNFVRSKRVFLRFMLEYTKHSYVSQEEMNTFYDLIAMQHFSTQATVMEIYGCDCLDDTELDYQLDWLYRWREQCERGIGND